VISINPSPRYLNLYCPKVLSKEYSRHGRCHSHSTVCNPRYWEDIANFILNGITFAAIADRDVPVQNASEISSKKPKILELIRVTGVNELYSEQDDIDQEQFKTRFENAVNDARRNDVRGEYAHAIEATARKYSKLLEDGLRSCDRVSLYATLLAEKLSDAEISMMLDYYTSVTGQKDILATRIATKEVAVQTHANQLDVFHGNLEKLRKEIADLISGKRKSIGDQSA
jgi:hypothetical protein